MRVALWFGAERFAALRLSAVYCLSQLLLPSTRVTVKSMKRLLAVSRELLSEEEHEKIGSDLVLLLRNADREVLLTASAATLTTIETNAGDKTSQDKKKEAAPSLPDAIADAFPSYSIRVRVRAYFGQLPLALALAQRSFSRADLNVVLSESALRGNEDLTALVSEVLTELQVRGLLQP